MKKKKIIIIGVVLLIIVLVLVILFGKTLLVKKGYIINDDLKYTQEYIIGESNIIGTVNVDRFKERSIDFDIGANKYGYAVFKNPEQAFKTLKKDYDKGIKLIQKEFNLLPLNNFTYKDYKTYGWQVTTGTEEEKEQARFVTSFMDIYEDSFNQ